MKYIVNTIIISLILISFNGCDLLDITPVNSMIPKSVEDFEAVLLGGYPRSDIFMKTELMTDNVYANLNTTSDPGRENEPWFIWANSHQMAGVEDAYWKQLYQSIFYANTVLDEFKHRTPTLDEKVLFETVRGEAYALRAYCLFYLVNLYADIYSEENLQKPGIPMPLDAEDVHKFTQNNVRESIEKVYKQIMEDIDFAEKDLAGKTSMSKFRFDYTSLQAFKMRVNLYMNNYDEVIKASTYVIEGKALSDLNNLQARIDEKGKYAFTANVGFIDTDYKNEILFFVGGKANYNIYYYQTAVFKPSEELFNLTRADENKLDYRNYLFLSYAEEGDTEFITIGRTMYNMYASQENDSYYIGFKVSEAYVSRAEAYLKKGNKDGAIEDLNKLLVKRFRKGDWVDLKASDFTDEQLLQFILKERRIELAFDAGLRWFDLRRTGKPQIVHSYKDSKVYTLQENDLRYILQIPESELNNSPNMTDNPR